MGGQRLPGVCRPSTKILDRISSEASHRRFFFFVVPGCPVAPYGRSCVTVRVGLLASQSSHSGQSKLVLRSTTVFPTVNHWDDLGAEVDCDGSSQPADQLFSHVAQEPRVTLPLVLRTTAQEKSGSIKKWQQYLEYL